MAILVSLSLFLLLMLSITMFGYRLYSRPRRLYDQLGSPVAAAGAPETVGLIGGAQLPLAARIIQQIGQTVPVSPQDASTTRRYLMAAGVRSDRAVPIYYGLKIVLCGAFLLAGLFLRDYATSNAVLRVVLLLASGAAGFFGPNIMLDRMVSKRREAIRLSLPDALDLLVVCMEAGVGLDQAVVNVSRELAITHPEITDELGLVTLEMRAGKRRADALKNLGDRTGEPELRKLVATLVQADRFGTSISEALRTHSDFMRIRRRQQAEERAAKVGVKLVFPIFFFILPSMLVVAAGPGILQLFKHLFPLMNSFSM